MNLKSKSNLKDINLFPVINTYKNWTNQESKTLAKTAKNAIKATIEK